MDQDIKDISRALNTINHHFNDIGKHVTVFADTGKFTLLIVDMYDEDIKKSFGPTDKDSIIYMINGMLETIRTFKYE